MHTTETIDDSTYVNITVQDNLMDYNTDNTIATTTMMPVVPTMAGSAKNTGITSTTTMPHATIIAGSVNFTSGNVSLQSNLKIQKSMIMGITVSALLVGFMVFISGMVMVRM